MFDIGTKIWIFTQVLMYRLAVSNWPPGDSGCLGLFCKSVIEATRE